MSQLLSVAAYSYRGSDRLACLLRSIRQWDKSIVINVAEDRSDDATSDGYKRICHEFGANHYRMPEHSHMSETNHAAVMMCDTPLVLVCSDDVMVPRGLIPAVEKFFDDNSANGIGINTVNSAFVSRIAGIFLHHWDRADIIDMAARGQIPELAGFQERDFFAGQGEWFIKHMDGRLPYPTWSEPTPPDKLGICPAVHGSAYVVSRYWFKKVGGTTGAGAVWQNDSLISARINNFSEAFIVRLPWLPSIPHFGGAAATPARQEFWEKSIDHLADEHGAHYRSLPDYRLENGDKIPVIEMLELGWRLRGYALQKKFSGIIDELDYLYKSE